MLDTFVFACLEITSQLYLLDHVPRHALKYFEPIRIFVSVAPWTLDPWFGVYLQRPRLFQPSAPTLIVSHSRVGDGESIRGLMGPL